MTRKKRSQLMRESWARRRTSKAGQSPTEGYLRIERALDEIIDQAGQLGDSEFG